MNPVNDPLYALHRRLTQQLGRSPLTYEQFQTQLRGRSDQDLSRLSPPAEPDHDRTVVGPKFVAGRICITPNAAGTLPPEEVTEALRRHLVGDWGDLCAHDLAENERALIGSGRLFSEYHTRAGQKFWIITEADRSVTTVLLPEDY